MPDPVASDGRHQRSARSRAKVVEAMLALFDEGQVKPGAARIAERAGVSERSVFRHFDDLEDVARAALEVHSARIAPFFAPPSTDGDRADRVAALADHRLRLHDRVMPGARAGEAAATQSTTLAAALDGRRRLLRTQVEEHFATDLDDLEAAGGTTADRDVLVSALDAASSLEAVEYLRAHAHHDRPAARAVLVRTLTALLAPTAPQER
jgi:AcrR family transcriptional regulator